MLSNGSILRGTSWRRAIRFAAPAAIAAALLFSAASASAAVNAHITLAGSGAGAVMGDVDPEAGGTPPVECSNVPGAVKTVCDTEGFAPHPLLGPTLMLRQEAAPGSIFTGWTFESGEGIGCSASAAECVAFGEPGGEIKLKATFVDAVQLSLVKGGHAAGGTVTSDPGGIECGTACAADSAQYPDGATVDLQAVAASDYVFAGWLGCTSTGPGGCEVTLNGDAQVFAIFLKDGAQGPAGPVGPTGPGGATGPTGPDGGTGPTGPTGPTGAQGPSGQNGDKGAAGAQGPAGSAGATGAPGPAGERGPAGRVVCQVQQKGERVNVTCKVRGSAASASKRRLSWRLMRGGKAHARGSAEVRHGGSATVRLPAGELEDGRYVLRFEGRRQGVGIVVS